MDVNGVLVRAKEILNAGSDQELSQRIGVPRATLASWKRRGSIPLPYLVDLAADGNTSIHWLLTGEGEKEIFDERGIAKDQRTFIDWDILWYATLLAWRGSKELPKGEVIKIENIVYFYCALVKSFEDVSRAKEEWSRSGLLFSDEKIYDALKVHFGITEPDWWDDDGWYALLREARSKVDE